jgi:adenosine deaminase
MVKYLDNAEFKQLRKRKASIMRNFLRFLPKGGLLHVHLTGAIPIEVILNNSKNIFVATSNCKSTYSDKSNKPLIYSLTSGRYMHHVKATNRRKFFKNYCLRYKQLSTLSHNQRNDIRNAIKLGALPYNPHPYALPAEFNERFIRLNDLTHDLQLYKSLFAEFLKKTCDENIDYIELMINPFREVEPNSKSINYVFNGKDDTKIRSELQTHIGNQDFDFYAAVFLLKQYIDVVDDFNKKLKKDCVKREGLFQFLPEYIDARFLIGLKRTNNTREEDLELAFKVVNHFINDETQAYRNKVLGINLMGDEFGKIGRPTDYSKWMNQLQQKYPDVHVSIHAGESTVPDGHVFDSILLDAERIGHCISLQHSKPTVTILKDKNLCIEACILSNKYLGYIPDVTQHPVKQWIENDLKVCLNTDDPGIFDIDMTEEFQNAVAAFDISLDTIKQLAMESIMSSFLPDFEKKQRLKAFDAKFTCFCDKYQVT